MVSTLPSDLKNVCYAEPGEEEKIQKLTDKFVKKIEEITSEKEKEIMEV